jgi:hypothetical protein
MSWQLLPHLRTWLLSLERALQQLQHWPPEFGTIPTAALLHR